jgi:protein SCO1/2
MDKQEDRRMFKKKLPYLLALIAIVAVAAIGYQFGNSIATSEDEPPKHDHSEHEHPVNESVSPINQEETAIGGAALVNSPTQVQDFAMVSDEDAEVKLSDFRGKAVMLFFGYLHCPDVCPTTLATFTQVKSALADTAEDVEFVFVSVDAQRDTPENMADYLANYDDDFVGLIGELNVLKKIGPDYNLFFSEETINVEHDHEDGEEHEDINDADNLESYFVQHTSPSFLIDRDGYLRVVYFYGTDAQQMAAGIRTILNNPIQ